MSVTEKLKMGSFGERMQREREMRSITLEAIAESTKISTRNLRALEQEKFSQLPGGIFNKGFVRAYARFLGIDEEQAVSDYLSAEAENQFRALAANAAAAGISSIESSQQRPAPTSAKIIAMRAVAEAPLQEPEPDHGASFLKALVILVFILGAGGFTYRYIESRGSRSAAAASPETAIGQNQSPKTANQETLSKPPLDPAVSSTDPTSSFVAAGLSVAVPEAAAVSNRQPETAAMASPIAVDIMADTEAWVQVKSDGRVMMEGVLSASAQKQFQAKKELAVKMGNAEAVQIVFNGQSLPRFGPEKNKNTRTLVFTPNGLRNP